MELARRCFVQQVRDRGFMVLTRTFSLRIYIWLGRKDQFPRLRRKHTPTLLSRVNDKPSAGELYANNTRTLRYLRR